MRVRRVVTVACLALACEQRPSTAVADAGYDCERERSALVSELKQAWPCSAPSQCQLLAIDGLVCPTPVPTGMAAALRARGQAWRSRCKPKHFDCFDHGQAACIGGRCAIEALPQQY